MYNKQVGVVFFAMYSQLNLKILNNDDENSEPYEYIFILSKHEPYIDFKQTLFNKDFNIYNIKINLNDDDFIYTKSNYILRLSINTIVGADIKFIKSSLFYKYDINFIEKKDDGEITGLEYNGNKCYTKNIKKDIDKSGISEIIANSFKYYIKHRCKFNETLDSEKILNDYYQNYGKKLYSQQCKNLLKYINIYKSILLRFEIYKEKNGDQIEKKTKSCTFLPCDKTNYSNLFYIYQYVIKMIENQSLYKTKTFTNPKNESFFKNNYKLILLDYKLKLRIFVSKFNIYNSIYYRKTTELNKYNIYCLVDNSFNKIIGFQFNESVYYIWKNNGDLNTYDDYIEDGDYLNLLLNTFKDALLFLFKIY